jgi:hypothetical protein
MNQHVIPAGQTAIATPTTDATGLWLAMIERAAKDPAVDLAKLERMLQMRAQEEARQASWRYRESMTACQAAMDSIRADAKNDQTRSRYATLAAVDAAARPVYTRFGFSVSYDTADTEKPDCIRVVARVFHAGGHCEEHHIDMPCDGKGIKGNAMMTATHSVASGISYARRYLVCMIFSLCIDRDDDGNAAGRRHEHTPQPARPTPGKHADGQDNRFYRESDHDPRTGEICEDPAQEAEDEAANESREAFLSSTREIIRRATDWQELGRWWNSYEQKKARRDFNLTKEEVADLVAFVKARLAQLRQLQAAE